MTPAALVILLCSAQVLVQIGAFFWPALLPDMIRLWSLTNSEAGWITAIFYGAYMVSVPVLVRLKYQIMRATPDHSVLRKVATYRMLRVSPHQPVSPVRARAATQTADRRCTG